MLSLPRSITYLAAGGVLIGCACVATSGPALGAPSNFEGLSNYPTSNVPFNSTQSPILYRTLVAFESKKKVTTPISKSSKVGVGTVEGSFGRLQLPAEIGRIEGSRDMNLIQLEPTIINEKYYVSGQSERHQRISPTLPPGAPIPDCDDFSGGQSAPKAVTPENDADKKIDSELSRRLSEEPESGDDSTLKLRLVASSTDPALIEAIKILDVDIISVDEKNHSIDVAVKSRKKRKRQKVHDLAKIDQIRFLYLQK